MRSIEYVRFSEVNPSDFIPLLNNPKIREHLIEHELFDEGNVKEWIKAKLKVDSIPGCRVRAVFLNDKLAGWCAIQLENEKYEVAIIIEKKLWGLGKKVFCDIMEWAKELRHDEIFIHFLHTRPEYKFLRKIAVNVFESWFLGNKFTTYQLAVKN